MIVTVGGAVPRFEAQGSRGRIVLRAGTDAVRDVLDHLNGARAWPDVRVSGGVSGIRVERIAGAPAMDGWQDDVRLALTLRERLGAGAGDERPAAEAPSPRAAAAQQGPIGGGEQDDGLAARRGEQDDGLAARRGEQGGDA